MEGLIGGSEILLGFALFAGVVATIVLLKPRQGLQERLIVRFPGAWIVVGLLLTFSVATSVALITVGIRSFQ